MQTRKTLSFQTLKKGYFKNLPDSQRNIHNEETQKGAKERGEDITTKQRKKGKASKAFGLNGIHGLATQTLKIPNF